MVSGLVCDEPTVTRCSRIAADSAGWVLDLTRAAGTPSRAAGPLVQPYCGSQLCKCHEIRSALTAMPEESHDNVTLDRRQRESWSVAESEGRVQVDRLAENFNATVWTIRRDRNQWSGLVCRSSPTASAC